MRFHFKVALGLAIVVGAALAIVFLLSGGEEAEIEKLLENAAKAAERGDADAIITLISPTYRGAERDYEGIVQKIRSEVMPRRYDTVEVAGVTVHVRDGEAHAGVRVRVRAANFGVGEAGFRLTLRKESGRWMIAGAEEIR